MSRVTPQQKILGIGPEGIDPAGIRPVQAVPNNTTLDPLINAFPASRVFAAGWSSLTIDTATIPVAIPAGQHAFMRLLTLTPDKTAVVGPMAVGQEFVLASIEAELCSIDTVGGGGFTAWGSVAGMGAAVVVGKNLPGQAADAATRTFRAGTCQLPYVTLPAAATPRAHTDDPRLIWSSKMPAGAFAASPQSVVISKDFPPFVFRVTNGEELAAAFVLNGATANALRALPTAIQGCVELRIKVGLVASSRPVGI